MKRVAGRMYFSTFIKIIPDEIELEAIKIGNLKSCRIRYEPEVLFSRPFKSQMNRIRGRWNVAISRTSGYSFYDRGDFFIRAGYAVYRRIMRNVFGTQVRFSDLLVGAEFNNRRVEDQKECELLVFASIAAIDQAILFVKECGTETVYRDRQYMNEIQGLDFKGGLVLAEDLLVGLVQDVGDNEQIDNISDNYADSEAEDRIDEETNS